MIHACRVCQRIRVGEHLDFGPQSLRNRFLRSSTETEFTHPLAIGFCSACGTVQLADPPPVDELRPRFPWINYNEPERHLDELVAKLATLPGITANSVFAGLTYKDDSTLARLNRLGFTRTWRPELTELGIDEPNSGIESVQAMLTPDTARRLSSAFPQPDVLIVRHVLEHTHNTRAALAWAAAQVRPGGYVVCEVPDATRALERFDYTTVWEEHTLYFTPMTLRGCFEQAGCEVAGFDVESLESYPYPLEDSLVVMGRSVPGRQPRQRSDPGDEIRRAAHFTHDFPWMHDAVHELLRDRGRVAMLGAGHLTGAFINLYGFADRIEFVVDDNLNKQGLYMPGSRLPIMPSSALVTHNIDLCLMTVRPEIEAAVVARNASFIERGGQMASVFPDSSYALRRLARSEVVRV